MRFLVAAACLAVLLVTGYFFWGEYQKAQEAERVADFSKRRNACLYELDRYAEMRSQSPGWQAQRETVEACAASFLISADDINRAARR